MIALAWNPFFWLIAFLTLLLISKYALEQTSSWIWITFFLIISYFQGIIFAFTFNFPNPFISIFENSFVPLPVSVMSGIFYFFLCQVMINVHNLKSKKNLDDIEAFNDSEVKNFILKIWNIPKENLAIDKYDDGDNPNAQREFSLKIIKIHIGKNFLNLLNRDQLLFVLSHEIAHTTRNRFFKNFMVFCMAYIFFIFYISKFVSLITEMTIIFVFPLVFFLFIIGIMVINFIQWQEEYFADAYGCEKLREIKSAESFFKIEKMIQKDHGLLIDLIFFNHPSTKRRMNNIQKMKFE